MVRTDSTTLLVVPEWQQGRGEVSCGVASKQCSHIEKSWRDLLHRLVVLEVPFISKV